MNTRIIITCLLFVLCSLAFTSCKKNDKNEPDPNPEPPAATRHVKYEITGNYTGHLLVVYNDNVSGNTTVTVTSLPWSKDVSYAANVQAIGIGASTSSSQVGVAGQTATLKIYVNNTVVKSSVATADVNGGINLPTLAHSF